MNDNVIPLAAHTCSPASCDCEDVRAARPWPSADLREALSALTDEEAALVFELLATSEARRAVARAFPEPPAA